jgi:hypothetical protein
MAASSVACISGTGTGIFAIVTNRDQERRQQNGNEKCVPHLLVVLSVTQSLWGTGRIASSLFNRGQDGSTRSTLPLNAARIGAPP